MPTLPPAVGFIPMHRQFLHEKLLFWVRLPQHQTVKVMLLPRDSESQIVALLFLKTLATEATTTTEAAATTTTTTT